MTEIYESDLANKLKVSRTPIRDALKKLENDGLVETIPQVKSVVSKINIQSIREVNNIRSLLEIDIVNDLAKEITKKQISELTKINKEIKIIPSEGELPDTKESKELMIATIKNSNLTIGLNTTAMVDSVILNTPCISIKDELNFHQSLRALF